MTDEELDRLEQLRSAATAGDICACIPGDDPANDVFEYGQLRTQPTDTGGGWSIVAKIDEFDERDADLRLIEAAWNNLGPLIARARLANQRERENTQLRADLARVTAERDQFKRDSEAIDILRETGTEIGWYGSKAKGIVWMAIGDDRVEVEADDPATALLAWHAQQTKGGGG